MIDTKICDWLLENADGPIRYRVARELLKDNSLAKLLEPELLATPVVQTWLNNIRPQNPPEYCETSHGYPRCAEILHGAPNSCLENAAVKLAKLGLHGGLPPVVDAVKYYTDYLKYDFLTQPYLENKREAFFPIMTAYYLGLLDIKDDLIFEYMLESLDQLHSFASRMIYDLYVTPQEKVNLVIASGLEDREDIIKPEISNEFHACFPLIHDIVGLHRLYDLKHPDVDKKLNTLLTYISSDRFHGEIYSGYGLLTFQGKVKRKTTFMQAWHPKYPGWFDVAYYMDHFGERSSKCNVPDGLHPEDDGFCYTPKVLFFAEHAVKYPAARQTTWFRDLLGYLDGYQTENGTYLFPKEWFTEKPGYAVNGYHTSYGENRRKKNWCEIESTFFMQLLYQNV